MRKFLHADAVAVGGGGGGISIVGITVNCWVAILLVFFQIQSQIERGEAILDPVDFLALQSIRKSLEDLPGSNFFSSWDFTADPCVFQGVLCDGDRVVALNLGDPTASSPGLTGRIHPALGNLSALADFSAVPGRIYGPLPDTLPALRSLRFFALSRNFISGAIPSGLARLASLRTLDLSYNVLNSSSIPSLPPSLTNLVLCHNRLSGPLPSLASLTALSRLDLSHNLLSGALPSSLPPSLQYLSLSWNRLSGAADRPLNAPLGRLTYLDLSSNRLSGPIPGGIFSSPVANLQLQRNLFSGPLRPAEPVATVGTVDLSYNRLSGEIPTAFASVQNLYLNNNRFTGRVPGNFVDRLLAATIQTLYLQHNYLTGIEINPTADIPATASICLQYNCMVPPVQTTCPAKAGDQKTRPTQQCPQWRG